MCLLHTFVLRKPEEQRPPRRRCEENIKLSYKEIGLECVDWRVWTGGCGLDLFVSG
jgi:hypothetical protein